MTYLNSEILERFNGGMERALEAGALEPTAMTLATSGAGQISSRTVLLKHLDARGFVFYTNLTSRKGQQIAANPQAALTFFWRETNEQVLVEGSVSQVDDQEADDYFASRPFGSQIGAWASYQSQPLENRAILEQRITALEEKYADSQVPRPDHWSGYRVQPDLVEFWYGRQHRLHDRYRYQWSGDDWERLRLYP